LLSQDRVATVQTLKAHRAMFTDFASRYGGRIVDTPGDNILAILESISDAVNCAVEIQRELAERNAEMPSARMMQWRIGIELGDVVEEDGKVYGDGVNIAARIQDLAEPGGICVSGTVYDKVKNKLGLEFQSLGEQTVKNIPDPVRMYKISMRSESSTKVEEEGVLPLSEKPSIAVLPFDNMSSDPEQEYFSDGMAEEIITLLSKSPQLLVIARNSTFTYKNKPTRSNKLVKNLAQST